jgi:Domain of unknown function (DUF6398)
MSQLTEKQLLEERKKEIIELLQAFCTKMLNDEYFQLTEKLVQKLARKKTSPLMRGQLNVWAASVVHAIGSINFLFDKGSKPYASFDDIVEFFDTKKTTTTSKSKEIRDMFKMQYWDKDFSTAKMQDSSPFMQYVSYNGMMVPISMLPPELQQVFRMTGGKMSISTLGNKEE